MKYLFLQFVFFLILLNSSFAQNWGFWVDDRSYIQINFDGSKTYHYIHQGSFSSGLTSFDGVNLGTFTNTSQTLGISAWDIKTWKSDGGDVTGANLFYRVYKVGSTLPSFTNGGGGWLENLIGSNQRWGESNSDALNDISINISGFEAGSTYRLEVYIQVSGSGDPASPIYDNNGANNYIATFSTEAAFPVELSSFSANIINNSINLKWQTATEQNNYGFEIERSQKLVVSSENSTWENIGFVNGSGNSNSPKEYSYTDNSINNSGKYSYRLKQVDNDGSHEYSSIVEVDYNPVITFELEQNYPNPFNPTTVINYSLAEPGFVTVKVYNMLGEEVTTLINGQMEAGRHTLQFSATGGASKLSSGMYLYKITAGNFTQVKKMLLTK